MVDFSDDAILQLQDIHEFIARESPERAREQAEKIIAACRLLDSSPKMGRDMGDGTRKISKRPWVIIYEAREAGPFVVSIWHGSQDWQPKR